MMPSTRPSSLSHWRMNSVRMAATFTGGTQLASGFSWMRISSGASISVEKLTMGTVSAAPS
jgi:hypothetical protein